MSLPRGLRLSFGAFCVVVGLVTAGYVARADRSRGPVDDAQPAAVNELPLAPGTAYVVPGASGGATVPAVPAAGSGLFVAAGGDSGRVGAGRVYRYTVVVEEGAGVPAADFAAAVERTLAEPRGWTASRRWGFQRVAGGASDVTVHLATPATTDRLCDRVGVETQGEVSCRGGRTIVINLKRWLLGVPHYADALEEYRHMVVNHEIGHFLGHGHVTCGQAGGPAPVMQRQTFGLEGCVRNAWPYPDQRTYVTGPEASS
jgi:hypothetical protein